MALKCSSMSFLTEGKAAVLPTHCCKERAVARHWTRCRGRTHIEESCLMGNVLVGGTGENVRADLLGQSHDTVELGQSVQVT